MKEKIRKIISAATVVENINQAIIDDARDAFKVFIEALKKSDLLKFEKDSIPDKFERKEIKNFTIFMFVLELISLPVIFGKKLANKLRDLSIDDFSKRFNYNEETLLKDIKLYEDRWYEDIKAGINPFDCLGVLSILCKKLRFKKTVELLEGKIKGFSPILTMFLAIYLTKLTGRWKKINGLYNIK